MPQMKTLLLLQPSPKKAIKDFRVGPTKTDGPISLWDKLVEAVRKLDSGTGKSLHLIASYGDMGLVWNASSFVRGQPHVQAVGYYGYLYVDGVEVHLRSSETIKGEMILSTNQSWMGPEEKSTCPIGEQISIPIYIAGAPVCYWHTKDNLVCKSTNGEVTDSASLPGTASNPSLGRCIWNYQKHFGLDTTKPFTLKLNISHSGTKIISSLETIIPQVREAGVVLTDAPMDEVHLIQNEKRIGTIKILGLDK